MGGLLGNLPIFVELQSILPTHKIIMSTAALPWPNATGIHPRQIFERALALGRIPRRLQIANSTGSTIKDIHTIQNLA